MISILVFLSGFCALSYHVTWQRILQYLWGGDAVSIAVITSVFLLGLGIGTFIFGKLHSRPVLLLALIEIFIGIYGIFSYNILMMQDDFLVVLSQSQPEFILGPRFYLITLTAVSAFLVLPCIGMGATLPLIFECFIKREDVLRNKIGMLYGLNMLGAAMGVLLPPFFLFNTYGLSGTLKISGCLNILIGSVLLSHARLFQMITPQQTFKSSPHRQPFDLFAPLAFIAGFIVISYEILMFRLVGTMSPISAYTFPVVLCVILISLGAGSIVCLRWPSRTNIRTPHFLAALFLLIMFILTSGHWIYLKLTALNLPVYLNLSRWIQPYGSGFKTAPLSVIDFVYRTTPLFLLTFLPMFFMGGLFPALIAATSDTKEAVPENTGRLYLLNAVGCAMGAWLTTFWLFPTIGWVNIFLLLNALLFLCGILILGKYKIPVFAPKWKGMSFLAMGVSSVFLLVSLPKIGYLKVLALGHAPKDIPLSSVFLQEGITGSAAVVQKNKTENSVLANGKYLSNLPDSSRHAYLSIVPKFQKEFENVLLLGLGGGSVARDLLRDPRMQKLYVVDWSYELPLLLKREEIKHLNEGILGNPKLVLVKSDARIFVKIWRSRSFDAVIDNLTFLFWSGATGVRSEAFFKDIRRILKNDGHYYFMGNYTWYHRPRVIRTLFEAFPLVQEHDSGTDSMLICGNRPLKIDKNRMNRAVWEGRGRKRCPKELGLSAKSRNDADTIFERDLLTLNPIHYQDVPLIEEEKPDLEFFIKLGQKSKR